MNKLRNIQLTLVGVSVVFFLLVVGVTQVQAQQPTPSADHGTCIKCHEDLYFLHDTGNWFCIRESPMRCVDCHGGNPASLHKEEAHADRKAHPIINEDVSKCQECHPERCNERVATFDQAAGISKVLVAVPLQPTAGPVDDETLAAPEDQPASQSNWIAAMEIISPAVLIILVLAVYLIHRKRQHQINKKES